jgi:hypothetical protein
VRAQAELEGVREFECSTNPYGQRFLRRFEGLGSFRRKSLFVDARKLTIFELSIPGQAQAELGNKEKEPAPFSCLALVFHLLVDEPAEFFEFVGVD